MGWQQTMRSLWPFGCHKASPEATDAITAAELSRQQAFHDRDQAAELRVEAERAAETIRAHNSANHFDTWLQKVMREGMR